MLSQEDSVHEPVVWTEPDRLIFLLIAPPPACLQSKSRCLFSADCLAKKWGYFLRPYFLEICQLATSRCKLIFEVGSIEDSVHEIKIENRIKLIHIIGINEAPRSDHAESLNTSWGFLFVNFPYLV